MSRRSRIFVLVIFVLMLAGTLAFAQDTTSSSQNQSSSRSGISLGLIAIGAAIAVAGTAIGTGIAQSRIGAAGLGTIAERPESMGTVLILLAIPETMVILGFIVAVIILFTL